jgi:hypothetical protein
MKPRLYVEATIPSYLTSRPSRDLIIAGHQQITREWWQTRIGAFQLYISQLVIDEAGAGDPILAKERLKTLRDIPLLDITTEVVELASCILGSGKIPRKASTDAAHIAVAPAWNGLPGNLELCAYREREECESASLGLRKSGL